MRAQVSAQTTAGKAVGILVAAPCGRRAARGCGDGAAPAGDRYRAEGGPSPAGRANWGVPPVGCLNNRILSEREQSRGDRYYPH